MKRIILSCLLIIGLNIAVNAQSNSSKSSLNWEQKYKKAKDLAKAKDKPLLIYFTGSDWCGPCKMLDEDFFESEEFLQIASNEFVFYEADYPRNVDLVSSSQKEDNAMLMKKFNVSSYPTIIVLDKKENILGVKKGYSLIRDASYHFDFIKSFLNK